MLGCRSSHIIDAHGRPVTRAISKKTASKEGTDPVNMSGATPVWDEQTIMQQYSFTPQEPRTKRSFPNWIKEPKSPLLNYTNARNVKISEKTEGKPPGWVRTIVEVPMGDELDSAGNLIGTIEGIGDSWNPGNKAQALRLAWLSALLQVLRSGVVDRRGMPVVWNKQPEGLSKTAPQPGEETAILEDGTEVDVPRARQFIDYYCSKYHFPRAEFSYTRHEARGKHTDVQNQWDAMLSIEARKLGIGKGQSKKLAEESAYIDVTKYLAQCDPELWKEFYDRFGSVPADRPVGLAAEMSLGNISSKMQHMLETTWRKIISTDLWRHRPKDAYPTEDTPRGGTPIPMESEPQGDANDWMMEDDTDAVVPKDLPPHSSTESKIATAHLARALADLPGESFHKAKSERLKRQLDRYRETTIPLVKKMRSDRATLPVYQQASSLLEIVRKNGVVICMAATGSGKTTQIPQLILDDWIDAGEGSKCNIICTQPRRIAAVSVASRIARERDETLGDTVGYSVRFEAKRPQLWGSVTFVTTGVFLKMMQTALQSDGSRLAEYSHVIVDEVHERDVDTDLTLAVLKRLLHERRKMGKELKIILMSATIDPTLFTDYFADELTGAPVPVVEIAGRAFPVEKHYLDDVLKEIGHAGLARSQNDGGWVFNEKNVQDFIAKEIGTPINTVMTGQGQLTPANPNPDDMPEIPFPLVALLIAYVLKKSEEGHVLVFLPGWPEITRVRDILMDPARGGPLLGIRFTDQTRYELHILHSSVPIQEQEAVFEPARAGLRRIILATNIAETSVTIPDVVYVVDAARVKENRYDPDRLLSSLVSAWVGHSSLNQRAGRAGRHRPGEYYGVLSKARLESLQKYNVVEMLRTDLSNVIMRVKALNFPGIGTEQIIAETIEPPPEKRVSAAMDNLQLLGALDDERELTSLGKVLLHIPVDTKLGKLCMLGSFFHCLEPVLTIAAILSSRDIFVSPLQKKQEALAIKSSWSPNSYKSDVLASLFAYNAWYELQSNRLYSKANTFAINNFLHKPTLLEVARLKHQIVMHLDRAGILAISGAAELYHRGGNLWGEVQVPVKLNENAQNVPLLAALIAVASQPNFAARKPGKSLLRTMHDKTTMIHPQSVNGSRTDRAIMKTMAESMYTIDDLEGRSDAHNLYAFTEKVRNISQGEKGAMTYLRQTTRLDPLAYVLVGAHRIRAISHGLVCDDFLPIWADEDTLDIVRRLKKALDLSLLRVYEAIHVALLKGRPEQPYNVARLPRGPRAAESDDPDMEENDGRDSVFDEDEDDPARAQPLSLQEIRDLDEMASNLIQILDRYSEENPVRETGGDSRPDSPAPRVSLYGGPNSSTPSLPAFSMPWRTGPTMPFDSTNAGRPRFFGSRPASGATTPFHSLSRPATPGR
ncbi:P-loop containing nucleoside triphosphate hydrolase protein [Calocera viscosa TUFC12733]|uniref:RNA helicase n=1 Tax=Calocera viscosa (strain TUFC12733) TaxID=1330018 RepID=A0A167JDP0_CALVF|nr:P-loop containing nucleoside triphosphate hydrolase protein [Calocera viscosa TUFC12733]